jgi:hypothetical protein
VCTSVAMRPRYAVRAQQRCRRREKGRPRQDSNLRSRLRRAVLYPLSYGGLPPLCRGRAYLYRSAQPNAVSVTAAVVAVAHLAG